MTVSAEGIAWEAAAGKVVEQWTAYCDHKEHPTGFVMVPANGLRKSTLIPKRVMPAERVTWMRELLRRHASQAQGYPVEPTSPLDLEKAESH